MRSKLRQDAQLRFSGLESGDLRWCARNKVRKHALSLPAGARHVEDGGLLSHGSSATPPYTWAENCPPRSAGSHFFYINRLHNNSLFQNEMPRKNSKLMPGMGRDSTER